MSGSNKRTDMTFKEIINRAEWPNVAIAIVTERSCQRKNLEGYKTVFETLLLMEAALTDFRIVVERTPDLFDPRYGYPDVYGVKDGDDKRWSLVFSPWAEWLGMEVHEESTKAFSVNQITAYCLHEMTFFGFTEDKVNQQKLELDGSIEEMKQHPESIVEIKPEMLHVEITMKEYLRRLDRWLKWGTFARDYFGENASWFNNSFLRDEAPETYEELDRQTIKAALREIIREIEEVENRL